MMRGLGWFITKGLLPSILKPFDTETDTCFFRALILQHISHPSVQVEHVQCFLIMSSFLCAVNCLPQAWLLVGQAVRTAQDIGLHVSYAVCEKNQNVFNMLLYQRSPRRLLISPIEKETRRKVWWGCYTLDRMLALALGRPLGIVDSDCDIELPVDVDDEHLPEYFAGATMTHANLGWSSTTRSTSRQRSSSSPLASCPRTRINILHTARNPAIPSPFVVVQPRSSRSKGSATHGPQI